MTAENNNQNQSIVSMWLAKASNPETSPLKDLNRNLSQEEIVEVYESIKKEAEQATEEQMKAWKHLSDNICNCACCQKY